MTQHYELLDISDHWDMGGVTVSRVLERRLFSWRDDPLNPPDRNSKKHSYEEELRTYRDALLTDSIFQKLFLSPTFTAMSEYFNGANEVPLYFIGLKDAAGQYNGRNREINIDENLRASLGDDASAYLWIAAHEFRHAWHEEKNIFSQKQKMTLRDNLLLVRHYEADAVTFQTTVCWEIKEAGDASPWNKLIEHSNYRSEAAAFAEAVAKNPNAAHTGAAQNAVYRSWFKNRYLTTFYDPRSMESFKRLERVRKAVVCPFNSTLLLDKKFADLGYMPVITPEGDIEQRQKYLSAQYVGDLKGDYYRDISEAPTLSKIDFLESKAPKNFRSRPRLVVLRK